jgi:hypothetical protein
MNGRVSLAACPAVRWAAEGQKAFMCSLVLSHRCPASSKGARSHHGSYRLVAQVKDAPLFLVLVRFVGTHAEYDRIYANKA